MKTILLFILAGAAYAQQTGKMTITFGNFSWSYSIAPAPAMPTVTDLKCSKPQGSVLNIGDTDTCTLTFSGPLPNLTGNGFVQITPDAMDTRLQTQPAIINGIAGATSVSFTIKRVS